MEFESFHLLFVAELAVLIIHIYSFHTELLSVRHLALALFLQLSNLLIYRSQSSTAPLTALLITA